VRSPTSWARSTREVYAGYLLSHAHCARVGGLSPGLSSSACCLLSWQWLGAGPAGHHTHLHDPCGPDMGGRRAASGQGERVLAEATWNRRGVGQPLVTPVLAQLGARIGLVANWGLGYPCGTGCSPARTTCGVLGPGLRGVDGWSAGWWSWRGYATCGNRWGLSRCAWGPRATAGRRPS
jgi:hypothetical protein